MTRSPLARAMVMSVALHLVLVFSLKPFKPSIPRDRILRVSLIELRAPVKTSTSRPKATRRVKKAQVKKKAPSRRKATKALTPEERLERRYKEALREIEKKIKEKKDVAEPPKGGVFNLYLAQLERRIKAFWVVPQGFLDRDISAVIRVKIDPTGKLLEAEVERASGNPIFDRSVLQAVYKAEPYPPPPGGKAMEVGLVFRP